MADDLTTTDSSRETTTDTVVAQPRSKQPLARVQAVPWLIVILLIAAVAWLGWRAFGPKDLGDPLATSLVAFEEQNSLTVFSAEFAPVVSSENSRFFGALKSRQVAVIPTRVQYTLDLSAVDRSRLSWAEESRTLLVNLPPLRISKPNLDEARAQYLREGIWISRDMQGDLTRNNTQLAEREARKAASNPVLLKLAKDAARSAVAQNLAIPLQVAGFDDVNVVVRFDGESPAEIADEN